MSDTEDGVSRRGFLRTATAGTVTAAGVAGAATAQEGTTDGSTGNETGGNGTTGNGTAGNGTDGGGGGGGGSETVYVSTEDDSYVFPPTTESPLYISPGTTVEFVWRGSIAHNVSVTSQPEGASWDGHESLETAPFSFTHTFETLGEYEFVCTPHEGQGMVGTIIVNESGQAPAGGEYESVLPDSAETLGVAATGTMLSVLGLAYFFIKYGGDYGELE